MTLLQVQVNSQEEQRLFDELVASIEKAWQSPRQFHLTRPYPARSIAALRSSLPQEYASSLLADKLWALLNAHRTNGTCEKTFGTVDPMLVSQIAKYHQTVYASGGLSGMGVQLFPGVDQSDYPWDTVPKVVSRMFHSQQFHEQRQKQFRMQQPLEAREKLPHYDYLAPIVADADSGFGSITATMKIAASFVESGVAMVHIDDLSSGAKRFTIGEGRTVVPTSEYFNRIKAMRMQFDIMGARTMIMARCDTFKSEFISSIADAADHDVILGATEDVEPLAVALEKALADKLDYVTSRREWKQRAKLMTFDEAVKSQASEAHYEAYLAQVAGKVVHLNARANIAEELVGKRVRFDCELPRSREGQYLWAPTLATVLRRTLAVASLTDVTWPRLGAATRKELVEFHTSFSKVHPGRLYAHGYVGDCDYASLGFSPSEVESYCDDLAKLGVVWQVQPVFAGHGINMAVSNFAEVWQQKGIAGYMDYVTRPAKENNIDGFEQLGWSGAHLSDAYWKVMNGVEVLGG